MVISMAVTFRYGWWRVNSLIDFFSDESHQRVNFDTAFILLLISAAAYTTLVMLLGYMQDGLAAETEAYSAACIKGCGGVAQFPLRSVINGVARAIL